MQPGKHALQHTTMTVTALTLAMMSNALSKLVQDLVTI